MRCRCHARLRQRGEQYRAEAGCSTPTVQLAPYSGQFAVRAAWTAWVLALVCRNRRQCRERQADEQNTAVDFTDGISGPPHPRHERGPASRSSVITTSRSRGAPSLPMPSPYDRSNAHQSHSARAGTPQTAFRGAIRVPNLTRWSRRDEPHEMGIYDMTVSTGLSGRDRTAAACTIQSEINHTVSGFQLKNKSSGVARAVAWLRRDRCRRPTARAFRKADG